MAEATIRSLPIQLYLPIFAQHQINAFMQNDLNGAIRKIAKLRPGSHVLVDLAPEVTASIKGTSIEFLNAPFRDDGTAETETVCLTPELPEPDQGTEDSDESPQEWSEEAVAALHEGVLTRSLEQLNTRGNGKEKQEILMWIFNPPAMAYTVSDSPEAEKVWKFIHPHNVPFGFDVCCRFAGLDADVIRSGVKRALVELGLTFITKEQICKSSKS